MVRISFFNTEPCSKFTPGLPCALESSSFALLSPCQRHKSATFLNFYFLYSKGAKNSGYDGSILKLLPLEENARRYTYCRSGDGRHGMQKKGNYELQSSLDVMFFFLVQRFGSLDATIVVSEYCLTIDGHWWTGYHFCNTVGYHSNSRTFKKTPPLIAALGAYSSKTVRWNSFKTQLLAKSKTILYVGFWATYH